MKVLEVPYGPGPAILFRHWERRRGAFLLESSLAGGAGGRYSIFGYEPVEEVVGRDGRGRACTASGQAVAEGEMWSLLAERHAYWRARVGPATDFPVTPGCVGFLSYESGLAWEKVRPLGPETGPGLPDLAFGFYLVWGVADEVTRRTWLVVHAPPEEEETHLANLARAYAEASAAAHPPLAWSPAPRPVRGNFDYARYAATLERIREYIAAGDVYQINLAQRWDLPCTLAEAWPLYERLRQLNPAPYAAFLRGADYAVVSSSPEQFLRCERGLVTTRPIKGTRPRGATPDEDRRLAQELTESEKERAELLMIVDLERNDLGRVCRVGSVGVRDLYQLHRYATVQHLEAEVYGELAESCGVPELLRATFPGGSITGAPKVRAMQLIAELEPCRRGVFTGSLGWWDFTGRAHFNIAIRTVQIAQGRACVYAGSGIVWDSRAEAEYAETKAKAAALLRALNGDFDL